MKYPEIIWNQILKSWEIDDKLNLYKVVPSDGLNSV